MTNDLKSAPNRPSRKARSPARADARAGSGPPAGCENGLRGALLVAGGALFVALIAWLDLATGPNLSCSIFYLVPVVACAWWGGFPHGILLALGGSVAWHLVDTIENPMIPPGAGVWNGIVRFGTLTLACSLVSRLHAGVRRERWLARTDPLTGAANARTFYEAAVVEAERARRASAPLTLAYFDVDNFKQLNDRLGHAAGDDALRHVVETIQQQLGTTGLLARLGGDEFALLLPVHGADGAVALLAGLQNLLSQEMALRGWPVTLSVGAITFLRPAWDVDLMIQRVDALMYGAKKKGKARVEHEVIEDEGHVPREGWRGSERRAMARVLCNRAARVRGVGGEELATLCNISVGGIGLYLEAPLPQDTMLIVEPLSPTAGALLARVVRVVPEGGRWMHGCLLATRLDAEELGAWLGQSYEAIILPAQAPSLEPAEPAGR